MKRLKGDKIGPIWSFHSDFCSLQMLVKCIFGHKNALCQPVSATISVFHYFTRQGGWAAFHCRTLMAALPGCIAVSRQSAHGLPQWFAIGECITIGEFAESDANTYLLRVTIFYSISSQFTIFYPIRISSFFGGGKLPPSKTPFQGVV